MNKVYIKCFFACYCRLSVDRNCCERSIFQMYVSIKLVNNTMLNFIDCILLCIKYYIIKIITVHTTFH
jgi:hypothetical protein